MLNANLKLASVVFIVKLLFFVTFCIVVMQLDLQPVTLRPDNHLLF